MTLLGTHPRTTCLLATLVSSAIQPCTAQDATTLRVAQEFSFGATPSHIHEGMIGNPHTALLVSGGRIAVFDAHGGQVRFFSTTGKLLAKVGTEGEGPGGFRHISWAGKCAGDSLFVWDQMNARVSVISPSAVVAREFQLKAANGKAMRPQTMTCSRPGHLAGHEGGRPSVALDPRAPFWRSAAPITIYSARGDAVSRTPAVEASEMVLLGGGAAPRPLGRQTLLAMSTNGLHVGDSHTGRIEVFGFDGVRIRTLDLKLEIPALSTSADHLAAVEQLMTEVRGPLRDSLRVRLQALPRAEQKAMYTSLLFDELEPSIWAVVSPIGAPSTRLLRFNMAGAMTGRATIPANIKISEIVKGLVVGISENAEGEPIVVGYRISQSNRATQR